MACRSERHARGTATKLADVNTILAGDLVAMRCQFSSFEHLLWNSYSLYTARFTVEPGNRLEVKQVERRKREAAPYSTVNTDPLCFPFSLQKEAAQSVGLARVHALEPLHLG